MLELIEAISGRLIGPKTWDRNVEIFRARFGQSTNCLGDLCDNLCNKLCFGVYEVKMPLISVSKNGTNVW